MRQRNQTVLAHTILFFIMALLTISVTHPHLFWEHRLIVSYPVHSVMEAVGAIVAVSIRFLSGKGSTFYFTLPGGIKIKNEE